MRRRRSAQPARRAGCALDEVEPRTPIAPADIPVTITASGSYYLTGSVSIGAPLGAVITIDAADVSLDLNGFTIDGAGNADFGVQITSSGGVAVKDGVVRGCVGAGVAGLTADDVRLERLRLHNNSAENAIVRDRATLLHCNAIDKRRERL